MPRSIRIEDGHAVIRVPMSEVHSLRVALGECPCKATKSAATMGIRSGLVADLEKALARVVVGGKSRGNEGSYG